MRFAGFGHYGSNWFCGPGFSIAGPLGLIINLLFWGLVLYLGFRVVRYLLTKTDGSGPDPLTTLGQRYAKGEISTEEYQRMKDELSP